MHYRILEAGDGRFEIQRIEPVTIGVMYDAALADLFRAILETDDDAIFRAKAAIDDVSAPPAEVAASLPEIGATGLHKIGGEFIERAETAPAAVKLEPEPAPEPKSAPVTNGADAAPTEGQPAASEDATESPVTPMQEAFMRIEAGEKLGVVADDLGLKMPLVRAAYARRVRALKEEAEAAEPAPHVDAGVEECRMCGREFRANDNSDGLCARCQRGL